MALRATKNKALKTQKCEWEWEGVNSSTENTLKFTILKRGLSLSKLRAFLYTSFFSCKSQNENFKRPLKIYWTVRSDLLLSTQQFKEAFEFFCELYSPFSREIVAFSRNRIRGEKLLQPWILKFFEFVKFFFRVETLRVELPIYQMMSCCRHFCSALTSYNKLPPKTKLKGLKLPENWVYLVLFLVFSVCLHSTQLLRLLK